MTEEHHSRTVIENLQCYRERVIKLGEDFSIDKRLIEKITELINDDLVEMEHYNI